MRVESCVAKDKQYSVKDTAVRGLELTVYPSGRKSWKLRRSMPGTGRRVQFVIGDAEIVTLTEARRAAEAWAARIAAGEDPTAVKSPDGSTTLSDLFEVYMTEQSRPNKRSWKDDESNWRTRIKKYGHVEAGSLSRKDIAAMHKGWGLKSKTGANRSLSLLSAMFEFAVSSGWIDLNPCRGVKRFPEKSRDRFLTEAELNDILTKVEAHQQTWFRDLIKLAVFTGQRLSNVMSMRWDELQIDQLEQTGSWTIPAAKFKNGETMFATLTPKAVAVLESRAGSGEWVFPADSDAGHRSSPWKLWGEFIESAGFADLRIHDLRRSFGSLLAAKGVPLQVIGKALGHRSLRSTEIYARLQNSMVSAAVTAATEGL